MEEDHMKEFEEIGIKFSMYLKSYKIVREKLQVSPEELKELFDYLEEKEEFEMCEKIKKSLSL